MTNRIDISDLITQLCDRLDLGPKQNVRELVIVPGDVTATVYQLNEHGKKYIDLDHGKVALAEPQTIKVWT